MVKHHSVTRRGSKRRGSKSVRKSPKRKSPKRRSSKSRKSPKRKSSKRKSSKSRKRRMKGGGDENGLGYRLNTSKSIGGLAQVDRYTGCKSSGSNTFDN